MKQQSFRRISVVGLGYIGLPTAAMFASRGIEVIGIDVNQRAVDTINRGEIHIIEPDLDIVVRAVVQQGLLRATTRPEPAEAFLVAVPTPFKGEAHESDLSYIEAAAKAIAPVLAAGNLVILESTSPVGATEALAGWLAEARPDLSFPQTAGEDSDIRIAHCPERVLPGKVMQELITNDRVIGGMTQVCRDVNIAFANELSLICDRMGINVWELIRLANRHPRVNILQPGPGVGGHCIAVDPWFIVSSAPEQARLIRTAREVNDSKPDWVVEQVDVLAETVTPPTQGRLRLACFGLAFKADIDDLRESPALMLADRFLADGRFEVLVVEPNITALPLRLNGARLVSAESALAEADISVLLVDHKEFRSIRPPAGARFLDTRGIWD